MNQICSCFGYEITFDQEHFIFHEKSGETEIFNHPLEAWCRFENAISTEMTRMAIVYCRRNGLDVGTAQPPDGAPRPPLDYVGPSDGQGVNSKMEYLTDLTDPEIKNLYDRYKRWKGIPVWCPLSDPERHEFDMYALNYLKKKKEQKEKTVNPAVASR